MRITEEEIAEKRKRFEAFQSEPTAAKFRSYWRKEGDNARELAATVRSVVRGETAVSEEVIAECKAAVLRLNQIAYVLNVLACDIVGNTDAGVAAMEIVTEYQEIARQAAYDVRVIVDWEKIPGVSN